MKKIAFFYIILAGVCWGTSGIFVHFLAPYGFTSFQMTGVRATVSLLCILTFALIRDREAFRIKPVHLPLYLCLGVSLFFTGSCYFLSMQRTSVSTAVVLMYTAPIYVMIFSVLFLGEKLTKVKLTAIICMLIGCALVSGIVGGIKFDVIGILLGLASGIAYASYNIFTKILVLKKIKPLTVTLYGFTFMALISLTVLEPLKIVENASASPAFTVPMLIALGIVTFVMPYVLYTLGMKELSAGSASALSIVEPMSATLFSVLIFKEKLDVFSVFGIILILSAILIIGKTEKE